jgi:hypothetical protein
VARIAKEDEEFVSKGRKFINFLMDVESISHLSLSRVLNTSNVTKVRMAKLGPKNILKLMKAYSNNYKRFCSLYGYEVEQEVLDYLEELYR